MKEDDLTFKLNVSLEDFTSGKIKSIEPIDIVINELFGNGRNGTATFEESTIKTSEFTIYKEEFERNQMIEFSDGTKIYFIILHWLSSFLYKYGDLYILTSEGEGDQDVVIIDPINKTIEYPKFVLSENCY